MEQNRKPRNELLSIWSANLQQSRKEYPIGKRQYLQQIVIGKLDCNMQKNDTGPLSYTIHKNKFGMEFKMKIHLQMTYLIEGQYPKYIKNV